MSDDKYRGVPQGTSRIDLSEECEIRYWSLELGVSEEHLRQRVEGLGDSVDAVRSALGR